MPTAQTKYYEILTATMETHQNTTRKIATWYIEYHILTLQTKFRLLLNTGVYLYNRVLQA